MGIIIFTACVVLRTLPYASEEWYRVRYHPIQLIWSRVCGASLPLTSSPVANTRVLDNHKPSTCGAAAAFDFYDQSITVLEITPMYHPTSIALDWGISHICLLRPCTPLGCCASSYTNLALSPSSIEVSGYLRPAFCN